MPLPISDPSCQIKLFRYSEYELGKLRKNKKPEVHNTYYAQHSQYRDHYYLCSQNGNDSNLLIVFYVQIMPDDFVMQLHRF